MNEDTLQELAALHAVGALEGSDLQELELELASPSAAASHQVAAFKDLAALLAISLAVPQEPPRNLKAKILRQITGTAPVEGAVGRSSAVATRCMGSASGPRHIILDTSRAPVPPAVPT